MKQQNSRMVVEVNKLIANSLLTDGGIYLPNIGSISIATSTPEGGDPLREIVLNETERFKSLSTVISERGNCTLQQAEQVYKRWLEVVTEGNKTTILGIGEIENGKFIMTPQMYAKLNPVQARKEQEKREEPKETPKEASKQTPNATPKVATKTASQPTKSNKKESKKGYIWGLVAAIVAVIGVTYFVITFDSSNNNKSQPLFVEQVETPDTEQVTQEPIAEVAPIQEPEQEVTVKAIEQPKVVAKKIDMNGDPETLLKQFLENSKSSTEKYRVVFGVFSSPSNGGRAIQNVIKKYPKEKFKVRAYPYGGETYLLTLFESNTMSECERFIKSELGQSISNDLWINAKK